MYYVHDLSHNLLSIKLCIDNNCIASFDVFSVVVKDKVTGRIVLWSKSNSPLYPLYAAPSQVGSFALAASLTSADRWHQRLGHANHRSLDFLRKSMKMSMSDKSCSSCVFCMDGKSHRFPFPTNLNRASFLHVFLHSDVWTSPVYSNSGFKYFILFVDDFLRFTWIFRMTDKSKVPTHFHNLRLHIEKLCNCRVCCIQIDCHGEYVSMRFHLYLSSNGITHRKSCPHTPSENGLAERKIRHLVEIMRTLLLHVHMPSKV